MALTDHELANAGVRIVHHFCGDQPRPKPYIKETQLPAGTRLGQHAHDFDHLSVLVRGRVRVRIDDAPPFVIDEYQTLLIEAGRQHTVEALSDAIWLCVWSTESDDAELVDEAIERGE